MAYSEAAQFAGVYDQTCDLTLDLAFRILGEQQAAEVAVLTAYLDL